MGEPSPNCAESGGNPCVCEYIKHLKGLKEYAPIEPAVGGFVPPPPRVRVTRPVPDDTKVVSISRYTIVGGLKG